MGLPMSWYHVDKHVRNMTVPIAVYAPMKRYALGAAVVFCVLNLAGYAGAAEQFNAHITYSEYVSLASENEAETGVELPTIENSFLKDNLDKAYPDVNYSGVSLLQSPRQSFVFAEALSKLSPKWCLAFRGEGKTLPGNDPEDQDKPSGLLQFGLKYRY